MSLNTKFSLRHGETLHLQHSLRICTVMVEIILSFRFASAADSIHVIWKLVHRMNKGRFYHYWNGISALTSQVGLDKYALHNNYVFFISVSSAMRNTNRIAAGEKVHLDARCIHSFHK